MYASIPSGFVQGDEGLHKLVSQTLHVCPARLSSNLDYNLKVGKIVHCCPQSVILFRAEVGSLVCEKENATCPKLRNVYILRM